MSQGSISYVRARIDSGSAPSEVDAGVIKVLCKNAIRPDACGNGTPSTSGWIAGRHLFDTDFGWEVNGFSGALLAEMRTDSVAVPPAIRRAYRAQAEEEARGGRDASRALSRADRLEARDRAEQRWMTEVGDGRWRRHAQRGVLWDLDRGVVLAPVESESAFSQFKGLFQESFGCSVVRDAAGARAAVEAAAMGLSYSLRDAALDAFVAPPARGATDNEGAPRPLTERPDPAWAAGDPLDYFGNTFLLWLWWHCECAEGLVALDGDGYSEKHAAIVAERLVDLDCAWGVTGAISLRADAPTRMPEAGRALQGGKIPRRMGFTIAVDSHQWRCTVHGDRMAVSGLALPAPYEPAKSLREAIEHRVESVLAFDRAVSAMYRAFLRQRLSPSWESQKAEISRWIAQRTLSAGGARRVPVAHRR
ncbi:MAG: hypothetical protein EXS03_04535 [Phycisphaerales bacterium]|nr:hypothetical protein [Phycisphaerales bacterium]